MHSVARDEDRVAGRVTVRELAARMGVHPSTVARALKNDRRISEGVRREVKELAERMGYVPDPVLGALNAYRSARCREALRSAVFGIFRDGGNGWSKQITEGFIERCGELGFKVTVCPREILGTPSRLRKYYRDTGMDGAFAVVGCHAPPTSELDGLRMVWFGTEGDSGMPSVNCDDFSAVGWAFSEALARGYRRIGGAFFTGPVVERGALPVASFLHAQHAADGRGGRIPVFCSPGEVEEKRFVRWIERWRPDAIIGHNSAFYWLAVGAGLAVPEKMGFVSIGLEESRGRLSVVATHLGQIGRQAAHLLEMLYRAGRVLPMKESPRVTVSPCWVEGETLPARTLSR